MKTKYDTIGINYANSRTTDPRIEQQIHAYLKGAKRVVNIGAGTGSYEPGNTDLIAVEPSAEMISQRSVQTAPVVQAFAEDLPFEDNSFTHAMTVLSMHHWQDLQAAFREINRVAAERFVALTWNPDAEPFWLTRDYFPEIHELDQRIFMPPSEFGRYFDEVEVVPLPIPEDCRDGFLAAYWKRPEAYLQASVRQSISSFSKLRDIAPRLKKLKCDLESGAWRRRNRDILDKPSIDVGYIIVSARVRKQDAH